MILKYGYVINQFADKTRQSRLHMYYKIGVLKVSQN